MCQSVVAAFSFHTYIYNIAKFLFAVPLASRKLPAINTWLSDLALPVTLRAISIERGSPVWKKPP
ncbi:hypothetical protein [Leptolyngbya sp. 7M]|uniref:hypothetical protein n=1 Tax=Leptolyngbya sp. 7M TaxID=2812896 RepID=UPI001B8CDD2B|nr:hypothetical protein [Leptolyngbya sp. 7M]QYO67653.1 hypothetical protein JVX88_13180 [Leptolyngbya sp. 7M]